MLASEKARLAADVEWLRTQRAKLRDAQARLDAAFAALAR
jgi:hypothetical protein